MKWNNGICAVRHSIQVKNDKPWFVQSLTGRDTYSCCCFYPSLIPNGIEVKTIAENFKAFAI